jgi:hypothetical protein
MASGDGVVTPATEMSRHDEKPVKMAVPSKGNNLATMMACTATATRISIALHTTVMTKGKAPAAMTMIQLYEEQREAVTVAKIHRRTSRAKGVTLHHPHQAAPMVAAAAMAAQPGHAPPKRSAGPEALRHVYPLKRDRQVSDSLLPRPKVLWIADP